MSSVLQFRVVHFDDEPETIDWIPNLMFQHFRSLGTSEPIRVKTSAPQVESEDGWERTWFQLEGNGKTIEVDFRCYFEEKTLSRYLVEKMDLALLDVYREGMGGRLENAGISLYRLIVKRKLCDEIFFVTAYPLAVEREPSLAGVRVLTKPINSSLIKEILQEKIQTRLGLNRHEE